jgi:uncharacterized protein YggE
MTLFANRLRLVALATIVTLPFAAPVAAWAAETANREATIVVSGEGTSSIAPDLALISLGVVSLEKTAREALDGNNAAMAAVLKALKAQGIADKDLQTSDFSLQPQYSYPENTDGTQKPPVLTGYQVSNQVTIRVRDLAKLGTILDQTVTLGINQGGEIRFANAAPDKAIEMARVAAVKAAFAKAKTLADEAGVKLGRVVEISENSSRPEAQPMVRMSMAKQAADAVPVAAGESSYSVNVNITFAINQ